MGFYECIYDCGDNCYCVSIGSSLDNFASTDWIFCKKHKDRNCRTTYYDLTNFTRKFSDHITRKKVTGKVIDSKLNLKNIKLVKLELNMSKDEFEALNLKDYKKIFFSEFEDEPSWDVINGKIYIIDAIDNLFISDYINSPICQDPNIVFNWHNNCVMTIDQYKKYEANKNLNEENNDE